MTKLSWLSSDHSACEKTEHMSSSVNYNECLLLCTSVMQQNWTACSNILLLVQNGQSSNMPDGHTNGNFSQKLSSYCQLKRIWWSWPWWFFKVGALHHDAFHTYIYIYIYKMYIYIHILLLPQCSKPRTQVQILRVLRIFGISSCLQFNFMWIRWCALPLVYLTCKIQLSGVLLLGQ